jgi:protein archease
MGGTGHRCVPHATDLRIEAWAPSREECVAEAVRGTVAAFAEVPAHGPRDEVTFEVGPGPDAELLVAVLDEVVYRADSTGRVPAQAEVAANSEGLWVRLGMTVPSTVVGAVPKAVSLLELRFGRTGEGWACAVTLDV